jgi:hypothetical protein
MTEQTEQAFGEASVEQHAGWKAMEVANPVKTDDGLDVFGPGLSETGRAADELAASRDAQEREREGRPVDTERFYRHVSGPKSGERMPEQESVTAEQAAHDLTIARNQDETTADLNERDELARLIDEARSGVTSEQLGVPEPVAIDQQVQPQVQQLLADDDWQRHLQDPRILNAVQQHVDQANAQANAAAQAYNQAAINAAESAIVGLAVTYPELQGLTAAQFPTALGVIAKSNPQRAQSIVDHIGLINSTLQRGNEARVAQQQQWFVQTRKQFNSWAATQDADYEAFAQQVPAAERRAIEAEAQRMVLEGSDPQSVAMSWQTSPELRSAKAQRLLFDAARWRLAQRGAKEKQYKPVPNVQRPGSPADRIPDSDLHLGKLEKQLDSIGSAKAGAELLIARRARRR